MQLLNVIRLSIVVFANFENFRVLENFNITILETWTIDVVDHRPYIRILHINLGLHSRRSFKILLEGVTLNESWLQTVTG